MSETKRFYWLRMKDDFFNNKEVKKLRKIAGGDTFTVIYLKMQLLSIKNGGMIKFANTEDSLAEQLSLELDEDVDNVSITLRYMESNNLLENIGQDEFLLPKVPPLIGSETDSAERMREMRERNKVTALLQPVTQRKEIEIEKKIEIKKEPKTAKALVFSFPEGISETYKSELLIFIDHRKEIKKPMTQRALDIILKKLEPFTPEERTTAINNAITSLWSDVYPQKKKDKYGKPIPEPSPVTSVSARPTHCDRCGSPMVTNKCDCGRQLFCSNGVYTFEDGASASEEEKFNKIMRILP